MQTLPQTQEATVQPVKSWSWFTWLQMVVAGGMVLGMLRLLWIMHSTHRLISSAELVTDKQLMQTFEDLKKSLDCEKPIRMLMSHEVNVPATVGWWKPAILLPVHWRSWRR
ncbi:MAG: M56 family metallopeptidase [Gemmatales bacterium]